MNQIDKHSIEELSLDSLFNGRILLYQPKKGYRFSVDSPLLAWFSSTDRIAERCADLGSGCGVIGISLLVAEKAKHVTGVEIQPRLAAVSRQNAKLNMVDKRLDIVLGNLKDTHSSMPSRQFDLVVSNPPFWPSDAGRLPPDEERRIARHEISITLADVVQTAKRLLHPQKGRFCIAFPAMRLEMLFACIAATGLNTTRIVFVHPMHNSAAELVLLEARPGRSGQLKIASPLYLHDPGGANSKEAADILSGDFCPSLSTMQDLRTATR